MCVMDSSPSPPLAQSISAALDWWREAGVDRIYADEPQQWLAEPEVSALAGAVVPSATAPATVKVQERPMIGGDRDTWPQDLAAFHAWWLSEPSLADGDPATRVAPSGQAGAALMVVVPTPGEADSGSLLTGPEGSLVRNFARAAGIGEDELYLASALPRHILLPDWAELASAGMGEILRHHCSLVRPRRVLLLGRHLSALFGHDPAQPVPELTTIDIGTPLPALTSYAPERLLTHARLRAGLWEKWLKWTDESAS